MKNRTRRFLSVFLAASMLMGHGNMAALAEGTTEAVVETVAETEAVVAAAEEAPVTEAPTEPPTEAKTEAPTEPPTEAPTEPPTEAPTEPPTEAPTETKAEAPTEAVTEEKTETPTETPSETTTEAPVQDGNADGLIETELPSTEMPTETTTEAPIEAVTEAVTENITEKVTEKVTETATEAETEAKKDTFTWSENGLTVTVKLSKKDALPENALMTVTALTKKSDKDGWKAAKKLVEAEVNQGHRELSDVRFYEISFTVDGQPVTLTEKAEVTFTYEKALALALSEYAQPEAKAFALTEKNAEECSTLKLNDSQKLKKSQFTVKDSLLIGIAGIQNRTNDGQTITQNSLETAFGAALDYAVLANNYAGSTTEDVAAANVPMLIDEVEEDATDLAGVLASLEDYSLILANGKSSGSVKVINLYTNEKGKINTDPLEEVLIKESIDVSASTLVINLVAGDADQELSVPVYDAVYQGNEVDGELASYAGRIVYNLVAENDGEFVAYLGEATLDGDAVGTYLVPNGSLKSSDKILGAVYGNEISVSQVEKAVLGKAGETEEVMETEEVTEKGTETETEQVTERATEEVTEQVAETETEEVTEQVTETGTEEVTEQVTETETEEATEQVTEIGTEGETEAITENVTEEETEVATETVTEMQTEVESSLEEESEVESESETEGLVEETEMETETEILMAEESVALMTAELAAEAEVSAVKPLPVTKVTPKVSESQESKEETAQTDAGTLAAKNFGAGETAKSFSDTETMIPLAGAELAVFAKEDVTAAADGTVLDKDGKTVSYTAGSTVYAEGDEIYRWTSDAAGTAMDIAPYLVAGGAYVLRETATPDGYMKGLDFSFTIAADGMAKDVNGVALSEIKYENKQVPKEPDSGDTSQDVQTAALSLKVAVLEEIQENQETTESGDTSATPSYLAGAEFVIKDSNGGLLKDNNGNPYTFASEANVMSLNLDTTLFEALIKDLEKEENKQRSFYITEISASDEHQISGYSEVEFIIKQNDQGEVSLEVASEYLKDGVVIFYNKKIQDTAQGSISVEKRIYFESSQICPEDGEVFYVALFADKEKTVRISDIKTLDIKKGKDTAKVVFEKLENGTYYVGETDQYGNLVNEEQDPLKADGAEFYAEYIWKSARTDEVVIKSDPDKEFGADAETIALNNRYFELPEEGYSYTAPFKVKVEVKDENGNPLKVSGSFTVGLLTKQSGNSKSNSVKIALNKASSKTASYKLTMGTSADNTKNLYAGALVETKSNGKTTYSVQQTGQIEKGGVLFNISVEPQYITLKAGQEAPTITVTYTRVAGSTEPETESNTTVNPSDMKAELKLTKKVVYKNTAIRVNSVYYIGIFDDAALTKLRFKKAMTFTDASELTATLKVNLNKVETNEVTFYFAEVDEEGNVLKGGKEFGYDISLNKNSVTLNLQNMSEEIIVTNSVRDGESVAQQLTDPTSGLAGDSAALATAQNLATSGNSSENTETGDDSPILMLAIILIVSVLVIVAIIIFMIVRRKNRRKSVRRDDRRDY